MNCPVCNHKINASIEFCPKCNTENPVVEYFFNHLSFDSWYSSIRQKINEIEINSDKQNLSEIMPASVETEAVETLQTISQKIDETINNNDNDEAISELYDINRKMLRGWALAIIIFIIVVPIIVIISCFLLR